MRFAASSRSLRPSDSIVELGSVQRTAEARVPSPIRLATGLLPGDCLRHRPAPHFHGRRWAVWAAAERERSNVDVPTQLGLVQHGTSGAERSAGSRVLARRRATRRERSRRDRDPVPGDGGPVGPRGHTWCEPSDVRGRKGLRPRHCDLAGRRFGWRSPRLEMDPPGGGCGKRQT